MYINNKRNGYVAIISVLILSSVLVAVGVLLSTTAILEGQVSRSNQDSNSSLNIVESCAEDALGYLNHYGELPTLVTVLGNECNITETNQVDDTWTFEVESSVNDYHKKIRIIAERTDRVYILSWEEII